MMQITVEKITQPKPGKRNATAHFDGKGFSYNPKEVVFTEGFTYEVEVKSSDNPQLFFVEKSTRLDGVQSKAPSGDRWYMPFVSNTVAHAISAGLIKDSSQIHTWASAAKAAATHLDDPNDEPF